MPNATLLDVIRLAYKNPIFLDALLRNADEALKSAGLELTEVEQDKLYRLLEEPVPNTGREILGLLSQINAKETNKTVAEPGPVDPW